MRGWSSDSTVRLLPTGNSLLGKGAHPTLVSKLFLVLRRNLPSCHLTHRPGPLPQSRPARLHSLPCNHPPYTWQWGTCSLGFVIPRRTSSVASSVLKALWYWDRHNSGCLLSLHFSLNMWHPRWKTKHFWTCPPGIPRVELTGDHMVWFCNCWKDLPFLFLSSDIFPLKVYFFRRPLLKIQISPKG